MEEPGKLYDLIGDVPSYSDDPELAWEQAGARIAQAVEARRKRRRKLIIWWLSGLGLGLLLIGLVAYSGFSSHRHEPADTVDSALMPAISSGEVQPEGADVPIDTRAKSAVRPHSTTSLREATASTSTPAEKVVRQADHLSETEASPEALSALAEPEKGAELRSAEPASMFAEVRREEQERAAGTPATTDPERVSPAVIGSELLRTDIPLLTWSSSLDTLTPVASPRPAVSEAKRFSYFLWGGLSFTDLDRQFTYATDRSGGQGELGVSYSLTQKVYGSVSLAYSVDRIQTAFIRRTPINLYRPGTADTIYRYSTGQEEVITTDSVPGIQTQDFRHLTTIKRVGIPIQLGYATQWRKLGLRAEIGLMPMLFQQVAGVVSSSSYELTDLSARPAVEFRLSYRFAFGTEVPLGPGRLGIRYVYTYQPTLPVRADLAVPVNAQSLQLGYRWRW